MAHSRSERTATKAGNPAGIAVRFFIWRMAEQEAMRNRERNAKLILAMIENGKRGKEVADAAGITHGTLSQIVNRRRDPKPETVRAICRVLKRRPEQLGLEATK